ncbi:PAS domain-containing protein, partial [Streptomyces nojiriensis]
MWGPVCQAVALLLGPYAEVVLHDPETDRVLQIWNPMTTRRAGDPSL